MTWKPRFIRVDLIDREYGYLTVVARDEQRRNHWLCRCICSAVVSVHVTNLPKTASCGCLKRQLIGLKNRTHGQSHRVEANPTKEYRAWQLMMERCYGSREKFVRNYQARGIKVCRRWFKFENFFADMGLKPSSILSLDRIDNDGDYRPGNCRWATAQQQASNRRRRSNCANEDK